jgi:hypothetical protein
MQQNLPTYDVRLQVGVDGGEQGYAIVASASSTSQISTHLAIIENADNSSRASCSPKSTSPSWANGFLMAMNAPLEKNIAPSCLDLQLSVARSPGKRRRLLPSCGGEVVNTSETPSRTPCSEFRPTRRREKSRVGAVDGPGETAWEARASDPRFGDIRGRTLAWTFDTDGSGWDTT